MVSCEDTSVPKNKVEDIVLSSSFLALDIFEGNEVDLSEYSVTIKNSVNKDEEFVMSQFLEKLDTSEVGEHKFVLTYGSFSKEFKYEVKAILPLDAMFSGEIEYFLHDGADLDGHEFTVLYTNGNEEEFSLGDAEIDFSTMEMTVGKHTVSATWEGITFSVKVDVVTREILKDTEYSLIDRVGIFSDATLDYFVKYTDERFVIYTKNDGEPEERFRPKVKSADIENEYTGKIQANGKIMTCKFFLTKDGVVLEEVETE